jgi:Carbohydrate-selective porin, OprB family
MRLMLCFRGGGNAVLVFGPWLSWPLGAAPQSPKRTRRPTTTSRRIPTGESTVKEKTVGLLPNPLQKYGIKFAATYFGETLGNVSGGIKRGAVYRRLNLAVDVDLQKLVGAEQLTFHANMFQIHGGGLSRGALQNLFVVSGIEALPATPAALTKPSTMGDAAMMRREESGEATRSSPRPASASGRSRSASNWKGEGERKVAQPVSLIREETNQ